MPFTIELAWMCTLLCDLSSNSLNTMSQSSTLVTIQRGHYGGARGVMVIVVRNGYDDTSSNPRRDWLHFT